MTERQTMTVPEVARALGVSDWTAYQAVKRGQIPGTKRIGRRYVVSKVVFTRFLESDDSKVAAG